MLNRKYGGRVLRRMGICTLAILGAILGAFPALPAQGQTVSTIAQEGQQALGQAAGENYVSFGFPVIGPDGSIAFSAIVSASPTTFPQSKVGYIGTATSYSVALARGASASGTPGDTFVNCNLDEMSNSAQATGDDTITGPGITSDAIFAGGVGSWNCYAYQGQIAPGTGGAAYTGDFLEPSINSTGQIAFNAELSTIADGIFVGSAGVVSPVVLAGAAAPGLSTPFSGFGTAPTLSDAGGVTFIATTGVPGNPGPVGIWSGTAGHLQLIAATQNPAPGVGAGATFESVSHSSPAENRNGQIAFRGGLSDEGTINSNNDSGIWTTLSGSLTLVARAGSQAPGLPAGTTFTSFVPDTNGVDPVLNDTGEIAFESGLQGDGAVLGGIFAGKPGAIKPIVVAGEPVQGLPPTDSLTGFDTLHLNDAGQMIFNAYFTGPNVHSPYDQALISYDPTNGLNVVAMDLVTTPGIGEAPLSVYTVNDNAGYQPAALNDSGQFVFDGLFPDGYRVMTAVIPEPATGSICLAAMGSLLMRRRSRRGAAASRRPAI